MSKEVTGPNHVKQFRLLHDLEICEVTKYMSLNPLRLRCYDNML